MADLALLSKLSETELRTLNKQIVALIKQKTNARVIATTNTFHVGQKVIWASKRGYDIVGTVTKVKVKMIEVDGGVAGRWNVTSTLLKPV